MSAVFTHPELLDALARGVPVVLPNARAARALRQSFNARQRLSGAAVWDAPPVFSWTDWTRALWSRLISTGAEQRVLLNPAQEHLLWREVIDAAPTVHPLTSPDALAGTAHSAWSLAAAYQALPRLRSSASTYDSRTFAAWAESFARLCATQTCISSAALEDALAEHARSGTLDLTPNLAPSSRPHAGPDATILLAGFLDLTPSRRALLAALRSSGHSLREVSLHAQHAPNALRACTTVSSPREEIVLAARWLHRFFHEHRHDLQTPRVALLLPDPEADRAELDAVFREVLAPELDSIHTDASSAPWEFTSGTPLLAQPLVADALDLIRWTQGGLPIDRISALLRSPFLSHSAEALAACRFDAHILRRANPLELELSLSDLLRLPTSAKSREAAGALPSWVSALARFLRNHPPEPACTFAAAAEFFRSILQATGFPGDRPPTPLDFETLRTWDSTLDLLATLDLRATRSTLPDALTTLERLLTQATVHISGTHAPIQIMRPADAEGSIFDAVILLHANDDLWPEPQRSNPLLGWPLQRTLSLPGADPTKDAARSRARAEALFASTTHALVANASHDTSGPRRASPLIAVLGLQAVAPEVLAPAGEAGTPVREQQAADDRLLPPLPSAHIPGGARVLQLQAACAFQAFAELRLHSSSPEPVELGFNARDRGNIVHQALEHFWTVTRSQAELRNLGPAVREQRIRDAVDHALRRSTSRTEWSGEYLAVQHERFRRILRQWLEYELKRGPFVVLDPELERSVTVGPLQLNLRPDRIDQVDNGYVLVDYKTGRPECSAWEGERPDDPQLPLYAVLSEPNTLKGMFFGRLRPGKDMGWAGFASDATVLPDLRRNSIIDLDANIDAWKPILSALAQSFAEGRTDVAPKDSTRNCKFCGQRLLCRLDPAALLEAELREGKEQETDA